MHHKALHLGPYCVFMFSLQCSAFSSSSTDECIRFDTCGIFGPQPDVSRLKWFENSVMVRLPQQHLRAKKSRRTLTLQKKKGGGWGGRRTPVKSSWLQCKKKEEGSPSFVDYCTWSRCRKILGPLVCVSADVYGTCLNPCIEIPAIFETTLSYTTNAQLWCIRSGTMTKVKRNEREILSSSNRPGGKLNWYVQKWGTKKWYAILPIRHKQATYV